MLYIGHCSSLCGEGRKNTLWCSSVVESLDRKIRGSILCTMKRNRAVEWRVVRNSHICVICVTSWGHDNVLSHVTIKGHVSVNRPAQTGFYLNVHGEFATKVYTNIPDLDIFLVSCWCHGFSTEMETLTTSWDIMRSCPSVLPKHFGRGGLPGHEKGSSEKM